MLNSRYFILLSHIIGLLCFLSIPILFITQGFATQENFFKILFTKETLLFYGCYIFIFYFNTYFLIPRFFLKRKFLFYIAILLSLFIAVLFLQPFDQLMESNIRTHDQELAEIEMPPPRPPFNPDAPRFNKRPPNASPRMQGNPGRKNLPFDIVSVFLFVMTVVINLAFETSRQWRSSQKQALLAENEKMNAELSFLKAQINPHFLFNTLNNIYSLVVSQSEKAGPALLKLSNIMRYVTDDVVRDSVPLAKEVDCIKDFIELQKLRIGKKVHLTCEITEDVDNKTIAPLILLTFIENVFKYGLSNHLDAPITIKLSTTEKEIHFFCKNRIFKNREKEERAGVGIANTKKRLEYLYPNKHSLEIFESQEAFTVKLCLLV